MINRILILNGIIAILIFNSCKIQKDIVDYSICDVREKKVLREILSNKLTYSTIKFQKISIDFSDGTNSMNLNGWMRFVRDSCIIVSVNPGLGIELGRLYIFPDTSYFFDRFNKKIWILTDNAVKKKYFEFYDINSIQDIIIGNIPEYFQSNAFKLESICDPDERIFVMDRLNNNLHIKNVINSNFKNIRLVAEDKERKIFLLTDYGYNKNDVIETLNILINLDGKVFSINVEFGKTILNEKVETSILFPEKYEKKIIE
ncbi:MAG: DUF4292 domain-containing protein [Bacteroidales bacterium]|nr:DUF4292 domain-containing protein [Bacteroidales bacterium]